MSSELAELIQTVDPEVLGARIRTARIAAGLRQHELAEGVASVPYISRIEAGTRTPSLKLLAVIAERTHTTSGALLRGLPDDAVSEIELELQYASLEVSTGAHEAASTRLDKLSVQLPDDYTGPLRARLQQVRATTLEARGDLEGAIRELEALLPQGADAPTFLIVAIALSRCYRQAGQLQAAIDVGERAKARLSTVELEGSAEGIQLGLTIAGALFERGDVADAIQVCTRAIGQAERIQAPMAKASAYWNASIIESRRGNHAAALDYARSALPLMAAAEESRNLARLRGQYGLLLLRSGEVDDAKTVLQEALVELRSSAAAAPDLARISTALAEAELLHGNLAEARQLLAEIDPGVWAVAPALDAERAMLLGRLDFAAGQPAEAVAHYRDAIAILSGIAADRGLGEMWFELAELLDQAGDTSQAQIAYRAAAASAGFASRAAARQTAT